MDKDDEISTTQLDSHANMVVVGNNATIFSNSGKSADVRPFSSECSKMESVPIVDAAIAYDCPYTLKTYLITVRNALHVPSMEHNLIPLFIMREVGLIVNDTPKIHTREDLSRDTHYIIPTKSDNGVELRIPMKLDGLFSNFCGQSSHTG